MSLYRGLCWLQFFVIQFVITARRKEQTTQFDGNEDFTADALLVKLWQSLVLDSKWCTRDSLIFPMKFKRRERLRV
jgi:hypothetical protein